MVLIVFVFIGEILVLYRLRGSIFVGDIVIIIIYNLKGIINLLIKIVLLRWNVLNMFIYIIIKFNFFIV